MQYLNKEILLNNVDYANIKTDDLISADSYNEEEVMSKFKNIDKIGQNLLLKSAIHISIIGSGNRTFGMVRDDNNIVLEIKNIFSKYNIFHNKNINEKYDKNTLSARRLVRLLRYHIQRFIIETNRASFLWLKYSDRNNKMINICFPGAEHLVEKEDEAIYLLNTYKNVDIILGTKFQKRLERIFIARRILPPQFFLNNK